MSEKREDAPLRPLPSVSTPLLRADVEAAERKRRVIVSVSITAVVAGIVAFVVLRPPTPEAAPPASAAAAPHYIPPESLNWNPDGTIPEPDPAEVVVPDAPPSTAQATGDAPLHAAATVRSEARFGTARAFRQALEMAGLGADDFVPIEDAVREVLDFRRCRADDRLFFERDGQGKLVRFEYHQNPIEFVVATRAEDGTWSGRLQQREIERRRHEVGGLVRTSRSRASGSRRRWWACSSRCSTAR